MNLIKINDLQLFNKRIFIRSDMNVPIKDGKITSDIRICASLPTIQFALNQGACVILASHLGNPIEGKYDISFSLEPIVKYLKTKIPNPISFVKNYSNIKNFNSGELIVLENVRFNLGEYSNNETLAKSYANLCDIFVMDAFGTSHRVQASTYGIMHFVPVCCIGLLFYNELKNLNKLLNQAIHPVIAIIGGSKISTKLNVLHALSKITDKLIVTGGIANTFIAAQGNNIGKSICEKSFFTEIKFLLNQNKIFIPKDVLVANECSDNAVPIYKLINNIKDNEQILDLGNITITNIIQLIKLAKTIIWNGPVGMFELKNFKKGTETIAHALADSNACTIVGGGDTIASLESLNIINKISYISTGGGAFLKFLEGNKLPVIKLLESKQQKLYYYL